MSKLKPKNHIVLLGDALIQALGVTNVFVKCFRRGLPNQVISPKDAITLVKSGIYQGKCRKDGKRVHAIREIDPRVIIEDPSYWDGRAVIRFHSDQITEAPRRRNKRIAGMWNRFLRIDPPPRNWTLPTSSSP